MKLTLLLLVASCAETYQDGMPQLPAAAPSTAPDVATNATRDGVAPSTSAGALPVQLDRQMIIAAIDAVRATADACGSGSTARGVVKVHVRVTSAGRVESTNVDSTPDPALGACVAAAVQSATFAPTQLGGSFRIPFAF